jgi:hypothetical protein
MLLVPEPPRDIEAQLLAAIDVDHPKRACFCVPADQYLIPPSIDAYVVRRPEGSASRARVVQARDAEGNVITEATASPWGFLETCDALESHVPEGGQLVILLPITAISRRVAMRWVQR